MINLSKTFTPENAQNFNIARTALLEKEYDAGGKILSKLAEEGYTKAQYQLGVLYWFGIAVNRDLEKAGIWCSLAANQGVAKAHLFLGHMHRSGNGRELDPVEAFKSYYIADSVGEAQASKKLKEVRAELGPEEILEGMSRAKRYLEKFKKEIEEIRLDEELASFFGGSGLD